MSCSAGCSTAGPADQAMTAGSDSTTSTGSGRAADGASDWAADWASGWAADWALSSDTGSTSSGENSPNVAESNAGLD